MKYWEILVIDVSIQIYLAFVQRQNSSRRSYLILGVEKEGLQAGLPGLVVGERTLLLEWRDDWHRRIRRLQRRAINCH